MRPIVDALAGHLWTIGTDLRHRLRPLEAPPARPWRCVVEDPSVGPVALSGRFRREPESDTAVVVVHGLGGDAESSYCRRMAAAASAAGWSCLRIALRGADLRGEDFYHAGLSLDLAAALEHPDLTAHRRVFLVGYSLGGHVAIHLALDHPGRVQAVATVGAPLDLAAGCVAIDRRRAVVYRHAVLGRLKQAYAAVARRHGPGDPRVPAPMHRVWRIQTLRAWDRTVVCPRHGFASAEAYYASQSVAPRLPALTVPTLYLGARHDPMVPFHTVERLVTAPCDAMDCVVLDRGGHVGFPSRITWADGIAGPVEPWIARWLDAVPRRAAAAAGT